jgi:predicted house-cleaning noncanonical NTP pyrophosphatase (MazG superfamily)
MTIKNFKTEKLVRDKIPALLESKGIKTHTKKLTETEYLFKLKDKLIEEAKEVSEAVSPNELSEELCDVLEVIHALAKGNGFTMQEIEQRRLKKRDLKGGFEERTLASFEQKY